MTVYLLITMVSLLKDARVCAGCWLNGSLLLTMYLIDACQLEGLLGWFCAR